MKEYKEDLTGKKFGKLTVLSFAGRKIETLDPYGTRPYWNCLCDCGNEAEIQENSMKRGLTTSCGCYLKQRIKETHQTHGRTATRLYNIWMNMKARCKNHNFYQYKDYGGRGITYSITWEDFEIFLRDMEKTYAEHLTLDRVDVNGNYCKENCKWSTRSEQNRNQRKKKVNKTGVNGVSLSSNSTRYVSQWSDLEKGNQSKSFSIKRHGEELAFFLACEYREQMINLLNLQGAGYSDSHGK